MKKWPHKQIQLTRAEIDQHIPDGLWQALRLSLKGKSTEVKLDKLDEWLTFNYHHKSAQVQVQNYINALRRGGQLNKDNEVVR